MKVTRFKKIRSLVISGIINKIIFIFINFVTVSEGETWKFFLGLYLVILELYVKYLIIFLYSQVK